MSGPKTTGAPPFEKNKRAKKGLEQADEIIRGGNPPVKL